MIAFFHRWNQLACWQYPTGTEESSGSKAGTQDKLSVLFYCIVLIYRYITLLLVNCTLYNCFFNIEPHGGWKHYQVRSKEVSGFILIGFTLRPFFSLLLVVGQIYVVRIIVPLHSMLCRLRDVLFSHAGEVQSLEKRMLQLNTVC